MVSPERRPPAPEDEDTKSPEAIAAALLRHFSRKHRQAAGDIDWLVSYADAPQLVSFIYLFLLTFTKITYTYNIQFT